MEQEKGTNFSLFRPHSDYARKNRNIILSMLVIWAVAVFGFQILLKVIEKPTPEESNITFNRIWPSYIDGQAGIADKQELAVSMLMVAGKTTIKDEHKAVLDSAISYVVYDLSGDSVAGLVNASVARQKEAMGRLAGAGEQEYLEIQALVKQTRSEIAGLICPLLNVASDGLEATHLPFHLLPDVNAISPELRTEVKEVLELYTVHNQSVLTDTPFLGFPFHYFYTAEFLLILFVVLCYLYNVRIERLQKKFGIVE